MSWWIVVCFFSLAVLSNGQGFSPAGQISEACFNCMCEASSECDLTTDCFNKGPGQYLCGPYHISYEYWKDSGKPGEKSDNPLDFENCLTSRPCAEAAIRGYMQKFGRDCNGDVYVDCYDWALLHKAGPTGCNSTWVQNTDYWATFKQCYSKVESIYSKVV